MVHPQRTDVAVDGEKCDVHIREANVLFVHARLGGLLHRQQTEVGRLAGVHEGWTSRV